MHIPYNIDAFAIVDGNTIDMNTKILNINDDFFLLGCMLCGSGGESEAPGRQGAQ